MNKKYGWGGTRFIGQFGFVSLVCLSLARFDAFIKNSFYLSYPALSAYTPSYHLLTHARRTIRIALSYFIVFFTPSSC